MPGSPCKDEVKNGLQSKYNAVDGDTDDRDLKAEVWFSFFVLRICFQVVMVI